MNVLTYAALPAVLAVLLSMADSASAQSRDVQFSYSPSSQSLSVQEPVVVVFRLVNHSAAALKVDLGKHRTDNFALVLTRPNGRMETLPDKPLPGDDAIFKRGLMTVRPGEQLKQLLLLNERTSLAELGKYSLRITLRAPVTDVDGKRLFDVPPETIGFEIGPRDEARLSKACTALLDKVLWSPAEANDAALALAYVQDPIALPYIEKALRSGATSGQILAAGLVRMGDPSAARVLLSVFTDVYDPSLPVESPDRMRGIALRQALQSLQAQTANQPLKAEIDRALAR